MNTVPKQAGQTNLTAEEIKRIAVKIYKPN